MTSRWCIAACTLLALFASSVNANLFDDVASFVKDSQAMEAFKEKLFDEDYAEASDAMKDATLDAVSAADAAGTPVPDFPQLFEGTVLNGFNSEEIPQEVVQQEAQVEAQEEAQEEEQPAEPCWQNDGAVEAASQESAFVEEPQYKEQPQVEESQAEAKVMYLPKQEQEQEQEKVMYEPEYVNEQPQAEQELEQLPMAVLQTLQAVLDAEAQTADEQFQDEAAPEESVLAEVEEYCAKALETCEAETCAGQDISENSCTKSDSGYQTACACGGTSTSSFSSPGFSGFSSSSSSTMGMPSDTDGLLRSMFSRRFGPFPRPPFSVEERDTAPRAMPLLSMLGALNNAINVPARPRVSFGMPSFASEGQAPFRSFARPMVEVVSTADEAEEEEAEEQPTVVDVTDLLRGPDNFRAMPVSIVRSFPVRLSFFNRQEPQQFAAEPLQTLEVPKPVAPAEPVLEARREEEAFDPFKWQRSAREWRPTIEQDARRFDTWRDPRAQGGPHRAMCMLVMAAVAAMLSATICCCCTRRPRADEEEVVVDVVGVDAYTPLMDTYCYEEDCAQPEKPLMPLDFEEPIKNPLK